MYQALYRKWRPKTFDDVCGQDHITSTLKNQIMTGKLSHAYLFIGTRGTGKTSCAKILAKAVNCEAPENGNPCNRCKFCLGVDSGELMDVVEMDAASNNGVDNVRALRDEAVFSPVMARKRVYIVDEVHMLSTPAFNALLKILEEPPQHLMFILATTELAKMPATILSRCQRHSFRRIGADEIAERLRFIAKQEGLDLEDEAALLLGRLADGSMRDGLSLLDQSANGGRIDTGRVLSATGLAGNLRIMELMEAICAGDTPGALFIFDSLWRDGKSPGALLSELLALHRDVLMTVVAPKGAKALLSGGYAEAALRDLSRRLTAAELMRNIERISAAIGGLRETGSLRAAAELCIISLCAPAFCDDQTSLAVRLSRLEAGIASGGVIAAPMIQPQAAEPLPVLESKPDLEPAPVSKPIAEPEIALPPIQEPDSEPFPELEFPCSPEEPGDEPPLRDSASGGDVWDAVLAKMEGQVLFGTHVFLSEPENARGEVEADRFLVLVKDSFGMGIIDTPNVKAALTEAVAQVLGRPLQVVIREAGGEKANLSTDKIDALGRFPNVTLR